jgi:splicing factor 45
VWQPPAASADAAPPKPRDQKGFAKRMMEAQGWVAGQGLGAEGNKGISQPLMAAKAKDGQRWKGKEESTNTSTAARGMILNPEAAAARKKEREQYGEVSDARCSCDAAS